MENNDFNLEAMTVSIPSSEHVQNNQEVQGRSWTIAIWTITISMQTSTTGAFPYTTI
ncbi:hypothetical protein [uncultured Vagococcus sp.]|uniref:hypothetical protein n=1 Tax=uncultured Vagococcus sp. TaxID=189676 RepID=UPI0028D0EE6A|nr:hypothetical protein [uncultured Vagococcus sp.]